MIYYRHIESKAIFTYEQLIEEIKKANPSLVFPSKLNPSALQYYGYYRMPSEEPSNPDGLDEELFRYTALTEDIIDNQVIVSRKLSEHFLEQEWGRVRKERNELLFKLDWVEASTDVTAESKAKVKAYKKLLRELPSLFRYPHQVRFPSAPMIEFKDTGSKTITSSMEEKLKNSSNMQFITDWHSLNFTLDKNLVVALCTLHGVSV